MAKLLQNWRSHQTLSTNCVSAHITMSSNCSFILLWKRHQLSHSEQPQRHPPCMTQLYAAEKDSSSIWLWDSFWLDAGRQHQSKHKVSKMNLSVDLLKKPQWLCWKLGVGWGGMAWCATMSVSFLSCTWLQGLLQWDFSYQFCPPGLKPNHCQGWQYYDKLNSKGQTDLKPDNYFHCFLFSKKMHFHHSSLGY